MRKFIPLLFVFHFAVQPVFAQTTTDSVCTSGVPDAVSKSGKLLPGMTAPWDVAGNLFYIKCMYNTLNAQLQTLKKQNEFLSDVSKVSKESMRQYDAVQNVSLIAMTERLKSDKENLTQLDNMDGMDNRAKLETITNEIDRRIKDPEITHKEKQRLLAQSSIARSLSRLQSLDDATNHNLDQSSGALNEKESRQIAAQSLAILAKLKVLEDKRLYEEFIAKRNDRQSQDQMSRPSLVFDAIGKPTQ